MTAENPTPPPTPQTPQMPGTRLLDGDGDELAFTIVELSSPTSSSSPPSAEAPRQTDQLQSQLRPRVPRAFHLDIPIVLRLVSAPENRNRENCEKKPKLPKPEIALVSSTELRHEFRAVSVECWAHGPRLLVKRQLRGYGWSLLLSYVAGLLAAVVSVVSYNLACDDASRTRRVIGPVIHNGLFAISSVAILHFLFYLHYPSCSHSARAVLAVVAMSLIYPVFFVAEWAMFPTKEAYFAAVRSPNQYAFSILGDGLGELLLWLGIFEFGRWYWIRSKSPGSRALGSVRTQSGAVHILAWILQVAVIAGIIASGFGLLSFTLARALTIATIVPVACVLCWSLVSRERITWSGGYALLFASGLFSAVNLSNLLPIIMSIGGTDSGVVFTMVKFFAYYIMYGAVFSACQLIVSRMTDQNTAPQFMFMFQVFIDAFVGMAFVELRTPPQFWALLVTQSIWALIRNTGLFAYVYLQVKLRVFKGMSRLPREDDADLLKRDQFIFYLNMQSILSDLQSAIAIPLVMYIDYNLPFGACSISCTFTNSDLAQYLNRYGIFLAFRAVAATIVVASYVMRYTAIVYGSWKNITFAAMRATAKSLLVAFNLHIWRNLTLFIAVPIYLYAYILYPVVNMHGFDSSSSSNTLSS